MPLFGLSKSDIEKMEAKFDVNGLVKALANRKAPYIRKLAVEALVKIGDARTVDALTVALKGKDENVRSAAAEALAKVNAAREKNAANKPFEIPADLIVRSKQEPDVLYRKGSYIGQKYEVLKELGHGGFGIVYLVYSHETKGFYAMKTFRDEYLAEAETRELFRKEANIWIDIGRHPYIVRAKFVEEVAGRLYIGMEYIAPNEMGLNTLDAYLERQPPDLSQSLKWAIQFCYGIEYACSKGVRCHRDIKPANIMISTEKAVKITDFGLAGVLGSAKASSGNKVSFQDGKFGLSTMEGKSAGTPTHMSPEQFTNAAACDERSDIYAFGIVLYQMVTGGRPPFLASSSLEMYRLHSQEPAQILESPLFPIIQRCLEKEPERRYQTFEELRADLELLLKRRTSEIIRIPTPVEFEAWEWVNKGMSLHNLGRFDEGLKCCDKALEINPKDGSAWNNKGICLHSLGRFDEAARCYDSALEINLQLADPWNNKGLALHSLGRFDEAIKCYDKALEINPGHAFVWSNKGISLDNLGHFDEAIKCINRALEIDPKLPVAWSNKGTSLHSLGRFEEAMKCYDRALEINPQYADAWSNKGLSLASLGRFDDAIKCYDKALEINPRHAFAWSNKGISLTNLGRFDEGMKCHDKALEINPKQADAWYNKGTTLANLGRLNEAIQCGDRALEITPRHSFAYVLKGVCLDNLGRLNEGMKCHDKALEINPRNASAWSNKAQNLRVMGHFNEAVRCCNMALDINPQLAEAWLNKGIAESKLGLRRDSAISMQKFAELAPEKARQLKRLLGGS